MPAPGAVVEVLKPITWFAPMWAFGCGVVSSGAADLASLPVIAAGVLLAGPMVCGTSQAINDWFDRHVDAINEPDRPIPSGRIPGAWGLYIAIAGTLLSLIVAAALGIWVFAAAVAGLALLQPDDDGKGVHVGRTGRGMSLDFARGIRDAGKSVVLIDHNILHVYSVADRFVVLDRGRVAAQFTNEEITREQLVDLMVELHNTGQVHVA